MKREGREVGYFSGHPSFPVCTKRVGTIGTDNYPANLSLQGIGRTEQMLLRLNYLIHTVIVGHYACYIHRYNHLGMLSDGLSQLVVIHLDTILLRVNHN